jgi:hypothetical protein
MKHFINPNLLILSNSIIGTVKNPTKVIEVKCGSNVIYSLIVLKMLSTTENLSIDFLEI